MILFQIKLKKYIKIDSSESHPSLSMLIESQINMQSY